MSTEQESRLWEGRFFVDVEAQKFMGYKDVGFTLFREDVPKDESITLLEACGLRSEDFENGWGVLDAYVVETFDREQVKALVDFFTKEEGTTIHVRPAYIPEGNEGGVVMLGQRSSGVAGYYDFSGYPLDFSVAGYYNLERCELAK